MIFEAASVNNMSSYQWNKKRIPEFILKVRLFIQCGYGILENRFKHWNCIYETVWVFEKLGKKIKKELGLMGGGGAAPVAMPNLTRTYGCTSFGVTLYIDK